MEKNGNENKMLLSVIYVNWNTRDYLLNCISQMRLETAGLDAEVIVVDNASSDDSVECVEAEYPDVVLVKNKENAGFARANNQGLAVAKGKYVFLVNTDVELVAGCIKSMLAFMDDNKTVGILGPKVLNRDKTLQRTTWKFDYLYTMLGQMVSLNNLFPSIVTYKLDKVKHVDYIAGCFWCVRKKAIDEVGLLDESFFFYGEDKDWCYRFREKDWGVVVNPYIEIIHYGGGSSIRSSVKYSLMMERAQLMFCKKHYSKPKKILYYFVRCVYHFTRIVGSLLQILFRRKRNRLKTSTRCLWELISFRAW